MSSWKYWCLRLTWNVRYTKICNHSSQIVRESRKEGLTKVGREWSGDRRRWQEKSLEAPFPGPRWFFALVFMFQTILEPEQTIIKIFETVKCKYHVYASLTFQLPMEHHLVIFVPLPHHCWLPTISKRQQRFTPHLQSAQSWWLNHYQVWISFFVYPCVVLEEGALGFTVLNFFSSDISVICTLMCGIEVHLAPRYAVFYPFGWWC